MKVLLVEDEEKLVENLKRGLEFQGYEVDVAVDGKEGYKKALKGEYLMILLDLMLPKLDGIEVCRRLRENNIDTPIIIITARGRMEDRILGLDSGADDYLVKPFGLEELFARIRSVLRRTITPS